MAYEQFAYLYDRLMEDMPYREWLRFADQCWERFGQPETVVELGCGTGNLTIPLAQRGLKITGIDLSETMLAVAGSKQEQAVFPNGGSIQWIHQDMMEWEMPAPVDAVISFCDSFNYLLDEKSVQAVFRQTSLGLKDEGLFVFDVHTEKQLRSYAQEQPFVMDEGDIAYIWTCELEESLCEIQHELTFFVSDTFREPGGKELLYRRVEETQLQRAYPLEWWERRLQQAGFTILHCCADFTWSPPSPDSERAFFVARKTG